MTADDGVLAETTLSIIHTSLAHIVAGSTNIINVPRMNATIHLRCLSLLDSLLVHLVGIWVEASIASCGIQLLLGLAATLLCLRV